ncbi:MAG: hypothetical protein KDE22_14445, partial [Rhodobacterales bacterium]|nr:hypothetical protein [Rhodobacterales bacterium]
PFPVPPQHMDGEELDITVYLHVAEQDDLYELCKVTPRVRDAITTYLHARGVPAKAKGMVDTRRAGAILNRVIARSLNSDIVSLVTVAGEARTLEEGAVPGTQADNPRNCVSIGLRAKRLKAN